MNRKKVLSHFGSLIIFLWMASLLLKCGFAVAAYNVEGGGDRKKKINPHTTWHGDFLAYLELKSQLHHVSKVNSGPKDQRFFLLLTIILYWTTSKNR